MHDPERTVNQEVSDDGIDPKLLRAEQEAMMWGALGGAPANRPHTVRPGDLTIQFESVHDDE